MIQKLIIPPDRDGYSFTDGTQILSVKLDGGASKYRQDILDAASNFNVSWTCDPDEYNYLRAFYKKVVNYGALPFLIDLYYDNPFELTEHTAHIVPGTFGLKSQSGLKFIVSATIEVDQIDMDQNNIDSAMLYGLFGNEYQTYNDLFDNLMNVQLPAIM